LADVGQMVPPHRDPQVTAALEDFPGRGTREVAAVVVDLAADLPVRIAQVASADTGRRFELGSVSTGLAGRRFEIGSVTKGLTGLLLADGIERGELSLDTHVEEVLPVSATPAFADLTVRELCTHTSGLPRLGGGIPQLLAMLPATIAGLDPYHGVTVDEVLAQAAAAPLMGRGSYRYSNLGAAVLGQLLVTAAAAADYPSLLRARLLEPLGMRDSAVAVAGAAARWGRSGRGVPRAPWVLGGYAPAGGVISTAADMGALLRALLDGSAPGLGALTRIPDVAAEEPAQGTGMFWVIQLRSRRAPAPFVWHNGGTGGYSSFVMLNREMGRGVAVLAAVAPPAELAQELAFLLFEQGIA
jgi:CubicO group peptidase (beta-lactamase class C family)